MAAARSAASDEKPAFLPLFVLYAEQQSGQERIAHGKIQSNKEMSGFCPLFGRYTTALPG